MSTAVIILVSLILGWAAGVVCGVLMHVGAIKRELVNGFISVGGRLYRVTKETPDPTRQGAAPADSA